MRVALLSLLLMSLLMVACGDSGGGGGDTPPAPDKAVKAATIADEIAASPDQMDAILKKHGMTMEEFKALIFEVTEDEALSEAYEAARKVKTPE
ncbi:MAG: hypothetical protein ABFS86_15245 [Planctomycetota bacterium]